MPEAGDAAAAYCTECGAELRDGECPVHGRVVPPALPEPGSSPPETEPARQRLQPPPHPRRRRALPLVLAALVVLLTASNAAVWLSLRGEIRAARRDASEAASSIRTDQRSAEDRLERRIVSVERRNVTLQTKIESLEATADRIPDPVAVIESASESVFTVFAGPYEGSAFAIKRESGKTFLITNFHVVASNWNAGRRSVEVVQGESSYTGHIVKVRRTEDLALVSIPGIYVPLSPATDEVQVGDPVIALGSPFGLEGTASTGIVSAVRHDFVQFSAPISPGSSGGPLLDGDGRVIGVNTAKVAEFGAEGLSFAIPIGVVCDVLVSC